MIHFSLHPNSQHQFVFTKFNLKVYALASFNWEQALSNSSIDKKISILNEAIINVMSNCISNEIKVFDDEKSPWMKAKIENLITTKNDAFKKHLKNNRNHYYTYKYKALSWKLENLIESSKQSYYKRVFGKLLSVSTSSKYYWSLLKRMLNDKKISVIPPLFHNSNFISNSTEKSELFNEHFSGQC